MAQHWTVEEMLDSPADPDDLGGLAARFQRLQERGAKRAADVGIDVKSIPNMLRQERNEMTEEERAEAEEILRKSLGEHHG